ncbi:MAG: hypothetical protein ABIV94_05015 [Acidimicrobiales bacterium]
MDLALAVLAVTVASIPISLSLWALLDVARRPQWAWALVGRRQVAWMAGIMFGTLTVFGGLAIAIWYLTRVRPTVAAAEHGDLTRVRRAG